MTKYKTIKRPAGGWKNLGKRTLPSIEDLVIYMLLGLTVLMMVTFGG